MHISLSVPENHRQKSKKMFSAISSYLFGDDATENEVKDAVVCDAESAVDDWILVDHVSIEGKTCFFHFTKTRVILVVPCFGR